MKKQTYLLFSMCILLLSGCGFSKREQAVAERTKQLDGREQQLLAWEQQLKLKEQELLKREQLLDSSIQQLNVGVVDSALIGKWQVKMKCTETNCPGSAIGDTKTEQWEVTYEQDRLQVSAIAGKNAMRSYSGFYKGNVVELRIEALKETDAHITIVLRRKEDNKLEGTREVIQPDGCKILYAMEVEKQIDKN